MEGDNRNWVAGSRSEGVGGAGGQKGRPEREMMVVRTAVDTAV